MLKKLNVKQFFVGPLRSAVWGLSFLIMLSSLVFFITSYAIKKDGEVRLFRESTKVEDQISNRMQIYANSMLAVRAFLYNLHESSPQELNRYIQNMQLFERYPGMKAFGYAEVLSKSEFTDNAYRLSQLVSNFSLDQYSTESGYYAIATSIYPREIVNQKVLGFDMFSEKIRRSAIIKAIEADKPILTDVITLAQYKEDATSPHSSGTLLFFPIYKQSDPRITHNIQNTSGMLFISLRSVDLFSAIFGEQDLSKEKIGFSLELVQKVADKEISSKKIYGRFEEKPPYKMTLVKNFEMYGQKFRLTTYPLDNFFTKYDTLFPYLLSLLTLMICALVFLNIRNNANYAEELSKTNNLINVTLHEQKEKQEDLIILNRTLQKMSHSLEVDRIVDSFILGVSDIFENKGKFSIYTTSKSTSDDRIHCHLISTNDDEFFLPDCTLKKKAYDLLFTHNDADERIDSTLDCSFLVSNPSQAYQGMCSKIESSPFGNNAFTVFISTSNEINESESVLFKALMKHFNTSIQNSLLLKKVEDSSQSKNAFLANMSHEIRTPLNALMGFSEILIRDDVDIQMKKDLSKNIIKNGKELSRLVDDILDLSKIEAGKIKIEKKKTDILELLTEIKSTMKMRIGDKQVELKIEPNGKIPKFVEMDPIRVKQILNNLIGNSLKFTEQGMVRVKISHDIDDKHRSVIIFRVEDTGVGIDRDFHSKLFTPFSQADSTSTRKYGGTGLGLAISRRLATDLGGELSLVFSEKDIGSVFELIIPVETSTDQIWTEHLWVKDDDEKYQSVELSDEPAQLKLKNILLVEDSPDNQDFFKFFLTQAGGLVKIVSNGLDAVHEANKNPYDIILMDIQIPGIDGKEATRRIRKQGYHGPIVALTAHAMEEEQKSCIKAGCNGQISKPVSGPVLISQVSLFIKGRHATS